MMPVDFHPNMLRTLALFVCGCAILSGCAEEPSNEPQLSQPHAYEYGTVVRFGTGGDSHRFRTTGWSEPEDFHTWSDGPSASVAINASVPNSPLLLTMRMWGMTVPPHITVQAVDVYVHGERIASWQVGDEDTFTATIPEPLTTRGYLNIDLHIPKAIAHAEISPGGDGRRLGIACVELKIERAPVAAAAETTGQSQPRPLSGGYDALDSVANPH